MHNPKSPEFDQPELPKDLEAALDSAHFRGALEFVRTMQETPEAWSLYKKMCRAGTVPRMCAWPKLGFVALSVLLLQGCMIPGSNSEYFAMDPQQAEANRKNTHRVEQEGRDMDNIERMRRAQAIELATRHNPRVINNSSTTQQTQVVVDH